MVPPEGAEVKRGKWNIQNLPVLPDHFDLVPIEKNKARLQVLKRLIRRADVTEIIDACDAGREGELIFRNIIRWSGTKRPTRRLWLQSMTPDAIRTGFEHLRSEQEMQPLADAARSRAESDWLVGINATRALTSFNSRSGGFQKTAAGRVQTPTLAILAGREEKIRSFKPRPYFEVHAEFGVQAGSYRGRWFDETFSKEQDEDARAERIWNRERAAEIQLKCSGKTGDITEEKKPTTQISPLLYDLTTLQREANGRFGLSARRTLQLAQALYEKHKVLTYPRTDSRYLPEDNLAQVRKLMGGFKDPSLASHAEKALRNLTPVRGPVQARRLCAMIGSSQASACSTMPKLAITTPSSQPVHQSDSSMSSSARFTTWWRAVPSPFFTRRRSLKSPPALRG